MKDQLPLAGFPAETNPTDRLFFGLMPDASVPPRIARIAQQLRTVHRLTGKPLTPERFHVLAFQQYGRVSGTDEHSIELRGVKRTDLNAVARPYWVTAVGPIKEGG